MLVWINGAFGSGKTSVARALVDRWPGSMLFDPERVGFMVREVVPAEAHTGDFQDIPLWRELTVQTIVGLLHDYRRPLVVPMTLTDPRYFDEVVGDLRRRCIEVRHFSLQASPRTLRRRLRFRLALPASRRWAIDRIDGCVRALSAPEFAEHVPTDRDPVSAVVTRILAQLPDPLPAHLGSV